MENDVTFEEFQDILLADPEQWEGNVFPVLGQDGKPVLLKAGERTPEFSIAFVDGVMRLNPLLERDPGRM